MSRYQRATQSSGSSSSSSSGSRLGFVVNKTFVIGTVSIFATCSTTVHPCCAFSTRAAWPTSVAGLGPLIGEGSEEVVASAKRAGNRSDKRPLTRMKASSSQSKKVVRRKQQGGRRRGGPSTFAEGYTAEAFVNMRHEVACQVAHSSGPRHRKDFSLTGGLDSCPCLVLNADYQPLSYLPLSLWGWQDVIKAVFMEKVTVVATYNNRSIRSAHMEVKLPSVIALKEFVNHHRTRPAFTRRNLFLRDGHKCQYCLKYFPPHDLSFDHVLPKKLGGKGTWENVVTACGRCNNRKSDCHPRDLRSIGMHLAKYPRVPTFHELQSASKKYPPRQIHETWEEFLYFESEIDFEDDDVNMGVEREGADGPGGSLQLPDGRRRQAKDWTGLK